MWDTTTAFGQRVERRLAEELVVWLVTTDRSGTPQPKPVWFLREGDTLLIYSKPDAAKVRHVQERPRVALNFNTDAEGDDVIVLLGAATVDHSAPSADQHAAYVAKYAQGIPAIGMSPEQFAATYSLAIRVALEKVRGW